MAMQSSMLKLVVLALLAVCALQALEASAAPTGTVRLVFLFLCLQLPLHAGSDLHTDTVHFCRCWRNGGLKNEPQTRSEASNWWVSVCAKLH